MRNSNLTLKLACYLIVAALLVWLGIYAYQALNDPYRTAPVTGISVRDAVEVRGVVAREEQVLYSVYSSVRVKLRDGMRVSAGGVVAEAFDSEEALLRAVRLAELRSEAEELTALLSDSGAESSQQADSEIQSGIRKLRQSVFSGNYSEAASLSQTLQTQVFAVFSDPAEIRSRLQAVSDEIHSLEQSDAARSDYILAPASGIYSGSVDGWEELGKAQLSKITVSALSALLREEHTAPDWALGKVVSGARWYFAALMDADEADRIYGQEQVTLRFSRYYSDELSMSVEWISPEEEGKRAILLSCGEHMSDVLAMRLQDAELVLSEVSGLRIPRQSLHVDGQGRAFVYVQTALLAEKKLVQVLRDYGDYYLVSSESLRAGDQVIISAKNLYEGKVVG